MCAIWMSKTRVWNWTEMSGCPNKCLIASIQWVWNVRLEWVDEIREPPSFQHIMLAISNLHSPCTMTSLIVLDIKSEKLLWKYNPWICLGSEKTLWKIFPHWITLPLHWPVTTIWAQICQWLERKRVLADTVLPLIIPAL